MEPGDLSWETPAPFVPLGMMGDGWAFEFDEFLFGPDAPDDAETVTVTWTSDGFFRLKFPD